MADFGGDIDAFRADAKAWLEANFPPSLKGGGGMMYEEGARRPSAEVKARTRTGPTGRYELSLPAGSYTLVVAVSGPTPQCPQTAVDVRAAGSGTVDIDCA